MAEDSTPTPEEEVEVEAEEVEAEVEGSEEEDFDKERALATIRKLRAIEKEHKARLAAEEEAKAKEAEAQKSLEEKLAERDKRIEELLAEKSEAAVRADFETKARARGYADPDLAYVAAKTQGVLGTVDPKTGEVGDHDFDKLEVKFPSLAGEAEGERSFGSGDAGVRGKQAAKGPASGFNAAIRSTIRGLDT